MSNLLINESPLMVLPSLAKAVGLNEAIMLQQVHYWLKHAKTKHDGKVWFYKTFEEWQEQDFSFWSVRTIKRIAMSLVEMDLLLVKKLAINSFNRVNHYTVNYRKLTEIQLNNAVDQVNSDSDNLAQSKVSDCHQHSDNLAQSDSDNLARCLRDNKETTKENIYISDFQENDVIAVNQSNANSIANWQSPSKNEMQAELVRAGFVLNMTDDQYEIYVGDFKAHFEQNALSGKPLTGERNRKNRLRQWLESIAKKQPKSNIFQGNQNANHQSANHSNQPKRSQADIYADKLNAELAERFPDEFAAPDGYYEARDCKSV